MTEIEPFKNRPRCPKCLGDRWRRTYWSGNGEQNEIAEHLEMECEACGYDYMMQTADQAGFDPDRQ